MEVASNSPTTVIPSVDEPGPVVEVSEVWKTLQASKNRRSFLRGMSKVSGLFLVGMATGIPLLGRPLRAEALASGAYEYHDDCVVPRYFNSRTICSPTTAYFGRDNYGANVLDRPGARWHRSGRRRVRQDRYWEYFHAPGACGRLNAWTWHATADSGNRSYMCSDGRITEYTNGSYSTVRWGPIASVARSTFGTVPGSPLIPQADPNAGFVK